MTQSACSPPPPIFTGDGERLGRFWSGTQPVAAQWKAMCGIYTGEKQIGKRLPICSSSAQSREHERACAVSQPADSSPLQLVSMIQVQIRKRLRICRRCARVRMSTAGMSWTHPIRPFRGVRCFFAGGCRQLPGNLLPCQVKRLLTGFLAKSDSAVGFAASGLFHRGEKISHEWWPAVLRTIVRNFFGWWECWP